MTKYEEKIYNIINTSTEHLTVEQIYAELKKEYPKVVLATVYNNVNKLWKARLIRKVSIENMSDRYDRIVKHDHLICQRCSKLTDISFEDLTASLREQMGEEFLSYDLKVFYICPECREREKNRKHT
ncbi:transcriptional repressor [Lachnospiraceae bacterium 66-29]